MPQDTRVQTIILQPGETVLRAGGVHCTCIAGRIWLTDRGRDIILHPGQSYCSNDEHRAVVVMNPGRRAATLKLTPGRGAGCGM